MRRRDAQKAYLPAKAREAYWNRPPSDGPRLPCEPRPKQDRNIRRGGRIPYSGVLAIEVAGHAGVFHLPAGEGHRLKHPLVPHRWFCVWLAVRTLFNLRVEP